jgi:RNA polymerase sigma factor (sigma-70 family)
VTQTTEVTPLVASRWQSAIDHQDLVRSVVNSRYAYVHRTMNIDKDDLIQVGLEIAARASHYAPDNMRGYLWASVRKGLADYIAGHGRTKARRRLQFTSAVRSESDRVTEPGYESVEDEAQGRYLFSVVDDVIAAMPAAVRERIRNRFFLRFQKGWDYQEIAAAEGVSHQAVAQSLERVLSQVRPLVVV